LNNQICTVCGVVLTEKLGHDYKAVVTAPTCTEEGYTTHTCSRCGDTYTDSETEALGHKPGAEADCLNDQTCTVCGEILAGKLGHDYAAVVTNPTCTEKGYTTHTCSRCGDTYTDSETDALGHKPGDWIVDQEPAPGVEGSKHTACTVCGETLETAVIEALPVETESETQLVTDPEPDTETEPVTTVPTDGGEDTTIAGETEKAPSGGGCAGNIHGISILFLLVCAAMISAVKRKRETE
jgi:hypothetical protein